MKYIIPIIISLFWINTISAQIPELHKYVIASGGDVVELPDMTAGITIGQTFIGPTAVSESIAGIGFWYTISDIFTGIEVISEQSAPNAILYQNYPNPFWDMTTIEFSIPEKNQVRMYVSDLFGKKINTLIDDTLTKGTYKIRFEGVDMSSGNYLCVLVVNDEIFTRKMSMISY